MHDAVVADLEDVRSDALTDGEPGAGVQVDVQPHTNLW
jgi:hypothetical protein